MSNLKKDKAWSTDWKAKSTEKKYKTKFHSVTTHELLGEFSFFSINLRMVAAPVLKREH
jgi:hypothetical protein